jgi:hypothetical protein
MMSRRFMNYCTGFSGLSYKECSIFMVNWLNLNKLLLFLSFVFFFYFPLE